MKSSDDVILIAKSVMYHSQGDEDAFFFWMKSIPCIVDFEGIHDELHIRVSQEKIDRFQLLELIGLFFRYHIDMKQLKIFDRPEFEDFFRDRQKYWYGSIFE